MNATTLSTGARRRLVSAALIAVLIVLGVVFRGQLVAWFTGKSMSGPGAAVSAQSGQLFVEASLDPDPPRTNRQGLVVRLRDAGGKPVDDATVSASYDMPAMGTMAEMKGSSKLEHQSGGKYSGRFDLPMSGTWTLKVSVESSAGSASQNFRITVGTKGLSAIGGGDGTTAPMPGMNSALPSMDGAASGAPGEIDHYTCSMHPSVKQNAPGKCPICGMDLIPVTKEQQQQGVVTIDEARRQLIGVRTEPVIEAPMRDTFRAVGHVAYDESSLADVNLKVRGWITKLYVSQTGQRVARGQTLFTLYSPELYNAEQDFVLATQGGASSAPGGPPGRGESLGRAARQRLHLLGLDDAQIEAVAKKGAPLESVPISAPAGGFVIEKNVVEGASVDPGTRLYRIAALDKVWIDADVYESDLAHVRVGQAARVTLDYLPGRVYDAKVAYVYPYLDPSTRTGRVRVELANRKFDLRPGMFVSVELASDLGSHVQVPAAAVVYTGPRRLVFVDVGEGRFRPQEVRVGTESSGMYEVIEGLKPGDMVATSGVFLIAAEARISTAAQYWEAPSNSGDAGAMPMQEPAPSSTGAMPTMKGHGSMPRPVHTPTQSSMPSSPPLTPSTSTSGAPSATVYSCPMHPEVKSSTPGKCPKCGMDMQPTQKGGTL